MYNSEEILNNLNHNATIVGQENAFENVVYKMVSILFMSNL